MAANRSGSSSVGSSVSNLDITWKPNVLVLGPGGTKGYMTLGSLKYLYEINYLDEVHTWVGCSIGSIISLLMLAGYTPDEVIIWSTDVEILNDASSIKLGEVIKEKGVVSNKDIRNTLEEMIIQQFGIVPSLQQLYQITGKDFYVTAVRIVSPTTQTIYFSRHTNPYMSCIDAVLLSSNIPGVFRKLSHNGYYYIDGAFGNPYPVNIVDDGINRVLGIYIMSDTGNDYDNIATYTALTLYTPINSLRKFVIDNSTKNCRHLRLMCGKLKAGGLSMTPQKRGELAAFGYTETVNFIRDVICHQEFIIPSDEDVPYIISDEDSSSRSSPVIATTPTSPIPSSVISDFIAEIDEQQNMDNLLPVDEDSDDESINNSSMDELLTVANGIMSNNDDIDLNHLETLATTLLTKIQTIRSKDGTS